MSYCCCYFVMEMNICCDTNYTFRTITQYYRECASRIYYVTLFEHTTFEQQLSHTSVEWRFRTEVCTITVVDLRKKIVILRTFKFHDMGPKMLHYARQFADFNKGSHFEINEQKYRKSVHTSNSCCFAHTKEFQAMDPYERNPGREPFLELSLHPINSLEAESQTPTPDFPSASRLSDSPTLDQQAQSSPSDPQDHRVYLPPQLSTD